MSAMLPLLVLVACSSASRLMDERKPFPHASFRLANTEYSLPASYPTEIGFFTDYGTNKLGVELLKQYAIYTCNGKQSRIRGQNDDIVYTCLKLLNGFELNVNFVKAKKAVKIVGTFEDIANLSILSSGVLTNFKIEEETTKPLTRSRAKYFPVSSNPGQEFPKTIGYSDYNGKLRISMPTYDNGGISPEYDFHCDGVRHFIYNLANKLTSYSCTYVKEATLTSFVFHIATRYPIADRQFKGKILSNEIVLENRSGQTETYKKKDKKFMPVVKPWPRQRTARADYHTYLPNTKNLPPFFPSEIMIAITRENVPILNVKIHGKPFVLWCDGSRNNKLVPVGTLVANPLSGTYTCNAKGPSNKIASLFSVHINLPSEGRTFSYAAIVHKSRWSLVLRQIGRAGAHSVTYLLDLQRKPLPNWH